jgi:MFS family permease
MTQPTASRAASGVSSAAAGTPTPGSRYAWYVVGVLTLVYMFSFVDRQILGLLVAPIERDFHVSDTQMGLLQGLAFALFYTFMGLPLGRMVDSVNRRSLVGVCVFIWSIFTSGCAAAWNFTTLFLARIGVGVGEAGLGPAAYSLIADYFPKERMGAAISVYYMGLFFGSSLALLVGGIAVDALSRTPLITVPLLGTIASWRITFLIVGLPGLLFAVLAFTIREPIRRNLRRLADGTPARASFAEAFGQMRLRWQSVVGISVGMAFQSMCTYSMNAWVPTYFLRVYGWTPGQTGKVLAVTQIVFACTGMYLGGVIADRWQKRGVLDARLKGGLISAAGIVLFLAPATIMPNIQLTLAFLMPGFFFMAFAMGTMVAAIQVIFPNQVRGQVGALFLFVLNLIGLTLGPFLPGFFNDHLFHNPKMVGYSLAITVGGAAIIMGLLIGATMRSYRVHYQMIQEDPQPGERQGGPLPAQAG